jgi:hypothetical protein
MKTHTLAAVLSALLSAPALAQSFQGQVDEPSGNAALTVASLIDTAGSLIGDYDPKTNPTGTLTRPGLFGGSGNNPIPTTADFLADTLLNSNPAGSMQIELDFEALSIRIDGLLLDLLNGSTGGTDLFVTLIYSTFNTINPSFIYPGGIPITIPLGEVASISRAELTQSGPAEGVMTETPDPDVFNFTLLLPAEAGLTLIIGLSGSDPTPTDLDAVPLALLLVGQVSRLEGGLVRLTIATSAEADSLSYPLDTGPLPAIPVALPTLSTATANVLLTLTPEMLTIDAGLDLNLVVLGEPAPAGCAADINGDGVLNFFDLAGYLDLYNSGSPGADLAPPAGVINFFDLAAYLDLYNAGCP